MKNILLLILLQGLAFVMNAQCLTLQGCPGNMPVCDFSTNDANLWNETYWWNGANQTDDLPESACELSATAIDTCTGANLSVKYLLFLDLNEDGIFETVVKSWDPPAPGTVNYNNYNNPNYDGGELRIFDERPVAADDKYRFALETIASGDNLTGYVRWNTNNNPAAYVNPELPYAVAHKIKWLFEDALGNDEVCEYTFSVKDCKNPTIVCQNGLTVSIMPTGLIQIWAVDFLAYQEDNATPTAYLDLGVRKAGTGSGFPEDGNGDPLISLQYDCSEIGINGIELWSRDAAGNADYCQTYVSIQDNMDNCNNGGGTNDEPVVICKSGLTVFLQSDGTVEVPTSFILQNAYDNTTPYSELEFGIRRLGSGTGFPVDGLDNPIESVIFGTADIGTPELELWVRDTSGHASFCETYILVQDYVPGTNAPTIVCMQNQVVNIMPTGVIQLWVTDFIQYVEDDVTPSNQIILGIRKSGTGTGFPEDGNGQPLISVVFSCSELGPQFVEVWAQDLEGNTSYCETTILVEDVNGNCSGALYVNQTICIRRWCDGAPLGSSVYFNMSVNQSGVFESIPGEQFDLNGCYRIDSLVQNVPNPGGIFLTPSDDSDPLNGVTPLDLVKISQHILGYISLPPYGIIAADANKSGAVTSSDIVELRKLLIGIYQELPNNTSWRFIDADFVFSNPLNPFAQAFPETVTLDSATASNNDTHGFLALKIGDVDCDGDLGLNGGLQERRVQYLRLPDAVLQAGETADIPVSIDAAGRWLAISTGLQFNPELLQILEIQPGVLPDMDVNCFVQPEPGRMNMLWFSPKAQKVEEGGQLFRLRVRALAPLRLSEVLGLLPVNTKTRGNIRSEGYNAQETPINFELRFDGSVNATGATRILPPQPNPAIAGAQIPVQLVRPESVILNINDVSGRLIWEQRFALPEGNHRLDIPAAVMNVSGMYFWKVKTETAEASGKLVKQ